MFGMLHMGNSFQDLIKVYKGMAMLTLVQWPIPPQVKIIGKIVHLAQSLWQTLHLLWMK